jgi:hypothetical protein
LVPVSACLQRPVHHQTPGEDCCVEVTRPRHGMDRRFPWLTPIQPAGSEPTPSGEPRPTQRREHEDLGNVPSSTSSPQPVASSGPSIIRLPSKADLAANSFPYSIDCARFRKPTAAIIKTSPDASEPKCLARKFFFRFAQCRCDFEPPLGALRCKGKTAVPVICEADP